MDTIWVKAVAVSAEEALCTCLELAGVSHQAHSHTRVCVLQCLGAVEGVSQAMHSCFLWWCLSSKKQQKFVVVCLCVCQKVQFLKLEDQRVRTIVMADNIALEFCSALVGLAQGILLEGEELV